MAPLSINSLGQPLSDNEIRRNQVLDDVIMTFRTVTTLEGQVATLEDTNASLNRQIIRLNVRIVEISEKLEEADTEIGLLNANVAQFKDKLDVAVQTIAHLQGQIGVIDQLNRKQQGQIEGLNQLNRQLLQRCSETHGWLCATRVQLQEAVDRHAVLMTQNQRLEDLLESGFSGEQPSAPSLL